MHTYYYLLLFSGPELLRPELNKQLQITISLIKRCSGLVSCNLQVSGGSNYGFGLLPEIVIVELPLIEGFALEAAVTVIVVAVSSAAT